MVEIGDIKRRTVASSSEEAEDLIIDFRSGHGCTLRLGKLKTMTMLFNSFSVRFG